MLYILVRLRSIQKDYARARAWAMARMDPLPLQLGALSQKEQYLIQRGSRQVQFPHQQERREHNGPGCYMPHCAFLLQQGCPCRQ
eukprot:scaffold82790_cov18-Tisochrysis_lutea.AAC.1